MKWLKQLLFLVVLLSFSLSTLYSEVVLTDEEFSELSTIINESRKELTELNLSLVMSQGKLKKSETSLMTAQKELIASKANLAEQIESLNKLREDDFLMKVGIFFTGVGFMAIVACFI
ncbi:MAG: hypothetical protein GY928_21310 [Colwellia sp.]|nr:hypothetical protein [Colwellia sp.]